MQAYVTPSRAWQPSWQPCDEQLVHSSTDLPTATALTGEPYTVADTCPASV